MFETLLIAITIFALIALTVYNATLQKKLSTLKKTPPPQAPPSEELSDFLADVKRHGYGFVRIDPSNVMHRSPRG